MGRSLRKSTVDDFEPKRKNPLALLNDSNLDGHLKSLKIGERNTPILLSEDEVRFDSDFSLNGKLKSHVIQTENEYLRLHTGTYFNFFSDVNTEPNAMQLYFNAAGNSLFISKGSFQFDAAGDISFDADGGQFYFNDNGDEHFLMDCDNTLFRIIDDADSPNDYFQIQTSDAAATTISTVDDDGTAAHLTLDIDGSIIFDPADGNYIAKNNGTEFSAANSAYAGMILGYTRLEGDLTNLSNFEIQNSMTVEDASHKVTFTTPPSENVEIEATFCMDVRSTDTRIDIGLSDSDTYNSVGGKFEYDNIGAFFSDDEIDDHVCTIRWVLGASELASVGSSNTFYIGFSTSGSTKTAYLQYGYRSSHGIADHPFVIKAIALPTTIYDGS